MVAFQDFHFVFNFQKVYVIYYSHYHSITNYLKLNELKQHKFINLFIYLFISIWPCHTECGILFAQPGKEPMPPALEALSLNHWTTREFPQIYCLTVCQKSRHNWADSSVFVSQGCTQSVAQSWRLHWKLDCGRNCFHIHMFFGWFSP